VKRANVYAGWSTRRVVAVALDAVVHDAVTQIAVALGVKLAVTKLTRDDEARLQWLPTQCHSVAVGLARGEEAGATACWMEARSVAAVSEEGGAKSIVVGEEARLWVREIVRGKVQRW